MKLRSGFEKTQNVIHFLENCHYTKADYFRIITFFLESAIYLSLSICTQLPLAEMMCYATLNYGK